MNLNPKTWLSFIAIIIVALIGWNFINGSPENQDTSTRNAAVEQVNTVSASITITPGEEEQILSAQEVKVNEGKTALDLTEKVADVETSGEGEMAFVTSINDREADASKNEFWELIINGEPAQVGAGSYEIKDGDKIEWRIATF